MEGMRLQRVRATAEKGMLPGSLQNEKFIGKPKGTLELVHREGLYRSNIQWFKAFILFYAATEALAELPTRFFFSTVVTSNGH